eukprot:g3845.t1
MRTFKARQKKGLSYLRSKSRKQKLFKNIFPKHLLTSSTDGKQKTNSETKQNQDGHSTQPSDNSRNKLSTQSSLSSNMTINDSDDYSKTQTNNDKNKYKNKKRKKPKRKMKKDKIEKERKTKKLKNEDTNVEVPGEEVTVMTATNHSSIPEEEKMDKERVEKGGDKQRVEDGSKEKMKKYDEKTILNAFSDVADDNISKLDQEKKNTQQRSRTYWRKRLGIVNNGRRKKHFDETLMETESKMVEKTILSLSKEKEKRKSSEDVVINLGTDVLNPKTEISSKHSSTTNESTNSLLTTVPDDTSFSQTKAAACNETINETSTRSNNNNTVIINGEEKVIPVILQDKMHRSTRKRRRQLREVVKAMKHILDTNCQGKKDISTNDLSTKDHSNHSSSTNVVDEVEERKGVGEERTEGEKTIISPSANQQKEPQEEQSLSLSSLTSKEKLPLGIDVNTKNITDVKKALAAAQKELELSGRKRARGALAGVTIPHPTLAGAIYRKSCHVCGNIRKNNIYCEKCPHIYCRKCSLSVLVEYGLDVFEDGCPLCKELCCCGVNRTKDCKHVFHCHKKCIFIRTMSPIERDAYKKKEVKIMEQKTKCQFGEDVIKNKVKELMSDARTRLLMCRKKMMNTSSNED